MADEPVDLLGRRAWLAFVAHAAVAFVVIAPGAYVVAQSVAEEKATEAVEAAKRDLDPAIDGIKIKQERFATEIEYMKENQYKMLRQLEKLDEKLDGVLMKHPNDK